MYPNYLIHFNKLHSKANGQFVSGDGDGDGTADEHHRYTKSTKRIAAERRIKNYQRKSNDSYDGNPQKQQIKALVNDKKVTNVATDLLCTAARKVAGFGFSKTKLGKTFNEAGVGPAQLGREFLKATGTEDIYKDVSGRIHDKVGTGVSKIANKAVDKYYGG